MATFGGAPAGAEATCTAAGCGKAGCGPAGCGPAGCGAAALGAAAVVTGAGADNMRVGFPGSASAIIMPPLLAGAILTTTLCFDDCSPPSAPLVLSVRAWVPSGRAEGINTNWPLASTLPCASILVPSISETSAPGWPRPATNVSPCGVTRTTSKLGGVSGMAAGAGGGGEDSDGVGAAGDIAVVAGLVVPEVAGASFAVMAAGAATFGGGGRCDCHK